MAIINIPDGLISELTVVAKSKGYANPKDYLRGLIRSDLMTLRESEAVLALKKQLEVQLESDVEAIS
uniref:Uncharacterized protein n=1 Tax=viral metagenome TaxID=1070528 RepID=A0A6H1ZTR1_9ZZZZ